MERVDQWYGQIAIESVEKKFTKISVSLPISRNESIYAPSLVVPQGANLLIVDDDPTVHNLMDKRIKNASNGDKISMFHSSNYGDAKKMISSLKKQNKDLVIISDLNLKSEEGSGVDLLISENVVNNSILATSADSEKVRERCQTIGLRLISKITQQYLPVLIA